MKYLLAVLMLLVPLFARADNPWLDGPSAEPTPTPKVEPKVAAPLSYSEAHALSIKTGKPLVAWVGVQALCPD